MPGNKKERLDALVLGRGLASSRAQAQALIQSGYVRVDDVVADKPGHRYPLESIVTVHNPSQAFASRGGIKLDGALQTFDIDLVGRVVLDVGAATGGFTDCALRRGARLVMAVDVGQGQLAWKLRQDERVQVLEKTNVRFLEPQQLRERPDFATVDVSFISLTLVLPKLNELLVDDAEIVALIKPQFEAGRILVSKGGGVIRDPAVHADVINKICQTAGILGWGLLGLTSSPLRGPEGNLEFFGWWRKSAPDRIPWSVEAVVADAHSRMV